MEAEASSRDLLQRFAGSTTLSDRPPPALAAAKAVDDVELSLGLSLGGCFRSNPRENTKLIRSSSVSSFPFLDAIKDENFTAPPAPLHRTCSLPVPGADEDYRKRKELQTLKRLEAKRKRSEKRNSLKGDDGGSGGGGGCTWQAGSRAGAAGLPPISQGSIGSAGSSSFIVGSMQETRSSSMANHRSSADGNTLKKIERKGSGMSTMDRSSADDNTLKKIERKGSGMSTMEEMPCVSTRGNGPNGKRIEGFLYTFRKGEEVRILCVCHGSFLTPAEFVRHAGGGDVDHPLRHIVVNPPSPFL